MALSQCIKKMLIQFLVLLLLLFSSIIDINLSFILLLAFICNVLVFLELAFLKVLLCALVILIFDINLVIHVYYSFRTSCNTTLMTPWHLSWQRHMAPCHMSLWVKIQDPKKM